MRKSEREVTKIEEKFEALLRCGYMTLAIPRGEDVPYLVPLNFGAELAEEKLVLYFHCAREGTKLSLLRHCPAVSFSASNLLRVFNKGTAPCGYTTDYESVCGSGRACVLAGEAERLHGLRVLMAHYAPGPFPDGSFDARALSLTEVVRIEAEEWTCKRLVRP